MPLPASSENATSQELRVVEDVVNRIITPSLTYQHGKVRQWNTEVVENCMQALLQLPLPRKYIVQCTILQKSGAGLHSTVQCYWDDGNDGSFTHRVENKNLICVTNVYGIAL
eukprot:TRINITY_DN6162_c1_g3_i1.p2 TRINITY_DN6162_c1_g3~~TRINITY_DN6162_c1_g3_i1.p2  ORF type:complete len:112 (+),score=42.51 TRINITY_DN6162_c1_g3_i1:88-423(+)